MDRSPEPNPIIVPFNMTDTIAGTNPGKVYDALVDLAKKSQSYQDHFPGKGGVSLQLGDLKSFGVRSVEKILDHSKKVLPVVIIPVIAHVMLVYYVRFAMLSLAALEKRQQGELEAAIATRVRDQGALIVTTDPLMRLSALSSVFSSVTEAVQAAAAIHDGTLSSPLSPRTSLARGAPTHIVVLGGLYIEPPIHVKSPVYIDCAPNALISIVPPPCAAPHSPTTPASHALTHARHIHAFAVDASVAAQCRFRGIRLVSAHCSKLVTVVTGDPDPATFATPFDRVADTAAALHTASSAPTIPPPQLSVISFSPPSRRRSPSLVSALTTAASRWVWGLLAYLSTDGWTVVSALRRSGRVIAPEDEIALLRAACGFGWTVAS